MRIGRIHAVLLITGAIVVAAVAPCCADVTVTRAPGPWIASGADYSVTIAEDGNVTSLTVGGVEFLEHNTEITRGAYLWDNKVLPLSEVERVAPNALSASSEAASIRYEFSDESMVWIVRNRTDRSLPFFLVFHPGVEAVIGDGSDLKLTCVNEKWAETTWFRGEARLSIVGSDAQWGPWQDDHQIWQASLDAGEERRIEFAVGTTPEGVTQAIADLKAPIPLPEKDLAVYSPREYEVFQRQTDAAGTVVVSGRSLVPCVWVEVRIVGVPVLGEIPDDWRRVVVDANGGFFERLTLNAGSWYRLEVRAVKERKVLAETAVEKFGVGEVFVGAGQSNSTNSGQFGTKQTSGMVSSFSGSSWQLADDPQPGPHDKSKGGSYYPAFGDALYERYRVPIGVAVTGHGGTSVSQWQPGGELFEWMMLRIHQLGPQGFRAVLWHQGESDAFMAAEEYYGKLKRVIVTSKAAAGWEFPWFVAQASYHNPEHPSWPGVREGQRRLWDAGVALQGPDTDVLTGDHRDYDGAGIHFSPKGLKAHGEMWADCVSVYLGQVLRK